MPVLGMLLGVGLLMFGLVQNRDKTRQTRQFEVLQLPERGYALLTFHRPVNVDTPEALVRLVELVETVCAYYPAVFPVHPRTRKGLEQAGLLARLQANPRLLMPAPMGYLPFLNLMEHAAVVITDSGGVQVESSLGWEGGGADGGGVSGCLIDIPAPVLFSHSNPIAFPHKP